MIQFYYIRKYICEIQRLWPFGWHSNKQGKGADERIVPVSASTMLIIESSIYFENSFEKERNLR